MLTFFFVRDAEKRDRFFSSEPPKPPDLKRSKVKEVWEVAKKKLMLLPQRTLRQETAFARGLKLEGPAIKVLYSGILEEERIDHRFRIFLHKKRSKRLLTLVGEGLLLPFTALTMPLPGPNVTFYALALLIITHWQSFRGVRAFLKKDLDFEADPLLAEWEAAVQAGAEDRYADIIGRIEASRGLQGLRKVLWK
jgi:hypothetical protein